MGRSMSEKVICHGCGKKYKWDEQFAGRKVKCACGAVFRMELVTPPAPAESSTPKAPPKPKTPPPPPKREAGPLELADEPPAPPVSATTPSNCPKCDSALQPGAVLCVSCGYHLKTGQSMRTSTAADIEDLKQRDQDDMERAYHFKEWTAPLIMLAVGFVLLMLASYLQARADRIAEEEWEQQYAQQYGSDTDDPQEAGLLEDSEGPSEEAAEDPVADDDSVDETLDGSADLDVTVDNPADEGAEVDEGGVGDEAAYEDEDYYDDESWYDEDDDPTVLEGAIGGALSLTALIVYNLVLTFVGTIGMLIACALCVRFLGLSFGNLLSALVKLPAIYVLSNGLAEVLDALTNDFWPLSNGVWFLTNFFLLYWLFDLDTDETWYVIVAMFVVKIAMIFLVGAALLALFL